MCKSRKFSKIPFILITSLFLVWGLFNNMTDTLLAAFKRIMSMTDFQTSWIQTAFYGSYFCLAIPAALYIKRFTYKSGVLLGLGLFIIGAMLFYPASVSMQYAHFLVALFVLAGGLAILETTANPYIIAMGPEATATRRLNLAQSFNPIGSILGIIIGKLFILAHLNMATAEERGQMDKTGLDAIQFEELNAVMQPYVIVALLLVVLWVIIYFVEMPVASDDAHDFNVLPKVKRLLKSKNYLMGIVAQFFYCGAQIGVWSFTIRYVMQEFKLNEQEASDYYLASIVLFMFSRFICTWLMQFIEPKKLLVSLAFLAVIATACVVFIKGGIGVYSLVLISACMSLMYPTIFGLAINGLKDDTKIASSGLVMAIVGGAVLTPFQGLISDRLESVSYSYIVPLVSFIVILCYGLLVNKSTFLYRN